MKALHEIEGRVYRPELLLQAEYIAQALLLPRTAEVTNVEIRPLIGSYLGSKDRVVAVAALYREPR
jgi:hypothetical protein